MKNLAMVIILMTVSLTTYGAEPGEIVKSSDGRPRVMWSYQAEQYCASQGSRLPTAREYALWAHGNVIETAFPEAPVTSALVQGEMDRYREMRFDSVWRWTASNVLAIDFYYTIHNSIYKNPSDYYEQQYFWTSSRGFNDYGPIYFMGKYGQISNSGALNEWRLYVRCVK